MRKILKTILLIGIDLILLYFSLLAVVFYRYHNNFEPLLFIRMLVPFSLVYVIWMIIFYFWDFYKLGKAWDFRDIFKAMFMNGIITIIFFYIIPYFQIQPKATLLLDVALYYFLLTGWRYMFRFIFRDFGQKTELLIIGLDKHSLELIKNIIMDYDSSYSISYLINIDSSKLPGWLKKNKSIMVFSNILAIERIIKQKNIKSIIVNNKWYSELFQELYHLIHKGIDLFHIASFWEIYEKSIPVYTTNELWFLENLRGFAKDLYEKQKRIIDLIICLLLSPFFICISFFIFFAVRFDSKGPAIYKQHRVGKENRIFNMYKFRTMYTDAEKHGPQWTSKSDPRVTRVGRILRAARLDEIPQLVNIIKGDMNFVGPRAERPEFIKMLSKKIPHYDLRHLIRPGLSGWAQVQFEYAASLEDSAKKLEYDLYYLKNRSHLLDIQIYLKTISTIVKRKGR
jgi:exopolysaccharide biosynthesis polyprenyl glycosylphosphotransferase